MPDTRSKVLAQLRPADTNAASLYSPPENTAVQFTRLVISNVQPVPNSATLRVFLDDDGTTYDQSTSLYFDQEISASFTWEIDLTGWGMANSAGNLAVRTNTASAITFTLFGME